MKKKIVPIVIITALVLSVGLNIWNYGYNVVYQRGFNAGTQAVSNAVMAQFEAEGKITVQMEDRIVALVPESSTPITGNVDEMFK